jgi:murein DD-endopeptidase MepM/ murein hydrolase activator NlpD
MSTETVQGGQAFDLSLGESAEFRLPNGQTRRLTLIALREEPDRIRGVVRRPAALVEVDGERVELVAGHYHLPTIVRGVKIACSVTRGIAQALLVYQDIHALDKDARLRCWAPTAPLFGPQPLVYPVRQTWFTSMTQLGNERTYVDAGELTLNDPARRHIYYHYGVDLGGYDKAVPVVAAAAGRVVRRADDWAADEPRDENPRDDVVNLRDAAGWRYRYSHLDMIADSVRVGGEVGAGDLIGFLGKKGSSGGWSHLHFGIRGPQPSGRTGEIEAWPYVVEAYLHEHPGALLACARPHRVAGVGETVELDASLSLCDGGRITAYAWHFQDGDTAAGPVVHRTYAREGMYSERVTVTDDRGRTEVDFCVVQILPPDADPARTPPTLHLTYYPTQDLRPGQPIAFKARAFIRGPFAANQGGEEHWDFGDGTTARTCSNDEFAERWHAYATPGRYVVTVQRTGLNGISATAQLKVDVGGGA